MNCVVDPRVWTTGQAAVVSPRTRRSDDGDTTTNTAAFKTRVAVGGAAGRPDVERTGIGVRGVHLARRKKRALPALAETFATRRGTSDARTTKRSRRPLRAGRTAEGRAWTGRSENTGWSNADRRAADDPRGRRAVRRARHSGQRAFGDQQLRHVPLHET